ncbi:MAG: hypothetical protein AB7P76_04230 [Candidatus Melainabacteria bacterium]
MNEQIQKQLSTLVDRLKGAFGRELVAVCVYGGAVCREKPNRISVIILLTSLTPAILRKAAPIVTDWEAVAGTLPVLFTREEWLHAADVFALECADIQQWHHVAYGEDLFGGLEVAPADLRLLCELELTRKLLLLRQQWMAFQQKPDAQGRLLTQSADDFITLFRGVLRLHLPTESVPAERQDILSAMCAQVTGFSADPFRKIIATHDPATLHNSAELWGSYLREVDRVLKHLNQPSLLSSAPVARTV